MQKLGEGVGCVIMEIRGARILGNRGVGVPNCVPTGLGRCGPPVETGGFLLAWSTFYLQCKFCIMFFQHRPIYQCLRGTEGQAPCRATLVERESKRSIVGAWKLSKSVRKLGDMGKKLIESWHT